MNTITRHVVELTFTNNNGVRRVMYTKANGDLTESKQDAHLFANRDLAIKKFAKCMRQHKNGDFMNLAQIIEVTVTWP